MAGPDDRLTVKARWPLIIGVAGAIGTVLVVCLLAGAHPYHALSNSDPGTVVRIGTSVLRIGVDVAATMCIGSLAFVALCTAPQESGVVSPGGYRASCDAARWAAVWLVAVLVLVPFDTADSTGQPLSKVLSVRNFPALVSAAEEPKAWLITTAVVLVVAIASRSALRWWSVVAVLGVAVFALLPPLATGHSSSESGHDLATDAIMVHVLAAVLWVGLCAAVLRHGRYAGVLPRRVLARYRLIGGICWLIVGLSGLADALVLAHPDQLFTTGYGALIVISILVLAGIGYWRRRALASTARILPVEVVALLLAMGLSAALTRLAPPAFLNYRSTVLQQLLGYDISSPAGISTLLFDWRIDLIFGPLSVVLAGGYLLVARRAGRWPRGQTLCWLAGCLLLLLASSSGIGRYASAMFSVHMLRHMLIGMLVPVLLALGAPISLARRAFPAASSGIYVTPLARFLTHPAVALLLFCGSPFVLYGTVLFDQAVRFHWAHQAIDAYFLVIGYLFAWITVGTDPAPHRVPSLARIGLLLAAMPADVLFGAYLINTHRIIGNGAAGFNFYQSLALPWVPSLAADQRAAGIIALVVGELALLLALAAVVRRWSPTDQSTDLPDWRSDLADRRLPVESP